jgi:hypothetical protein
LIRLPRALAVVVFAAAATTAYAAYDANPKHPIDLSGHWTLNAAQSDDPEAMLQKMLEQERQRYMRWRHEEDRMRMPGIPAEPDAENPNVDQGDASAAPPPRQPTQRPWQKRRDENYRRMLGITKSLVILQSGTTLDITSDQESRRVEAGSRTQVSMPEGQLADSAVGWDGEWFVIERTVKRGPHVVEKFRIVRKTGQLEYTMAWSGDTDLAGMKVRRIFERADGSVPPSDGTSGPER